MLGASYVGRIAGSWVVAAALMVNAFADSAFADSDPNPSSSSGLEEIVVTARKRVESSQETPLAISVLNEQALKDRQITQITDLQSAVPGFSVMSDEGDPFDSQLSLRGLSSLTSASLSVDPSVGIYV